MINNINVKKWWDGFEQAGIKLHAGVDVLIEDNLIYNCQRGIWLDWMFVEIFSTILQRPSMTNLTDLTLYSINWLKMENWVKKPVKESMNGLRAKS